MPHAAQADASNYHSPVLLLFEATAFDQDFRRDRVVFLEQFHRRVRIAIQDCPLQFVVLLELVAVTVLDDFGEIAVAERSLVQFSAQIDQYAGVAGRDKRQVKIPVMLFPSGRRCPG